MLNMEIDLVNEIQNKISRNEINEEIVPEICKNYNAIIEIIE